MSSSEEGISKKKKKSGSPNVMKMPLTKAQLKSNGNGAIQKNKKNSKLATGGKMSESLVINKGGSRCGIVSPTRLSTVREVPDPSDKAGHLYQDMARKKRVAKKKKSSNDKLKKKASKETGRQAKAVRKTSPKRQSGSKSKSSSKKKIAAKPKTSPKKRAIAKPTAVSSKKRSIAKPKEKKAIAKPKAGSNGKASLKKKPKSNSKANPDPKRSKTSGKTNAKKIGSSKTKKQK